MDQRNFKRYKDEELKSIQETEETIRQMISYKKDYEILQNIVNTLPEKCSYEILVPFGKKAFIPGKLVRTNEILVLLGDNWFVERSAKEAEQVISRRIEVINNDIEGLEKQMNLLQSRIENLVEAEGAFEIKEVYDEEKEKEWRRQHRENVRRNYYEERKKEKEKIESEEEVWTMLDKLEQNEREQNELLNDEESNSKSDEGNDDKGVNSITFKHTRLTEQQRREVDEANRRDVNSPADIYEKFACRQSMKESRLNVRDQTEQHCENKAFTQTIFERESLTVQEKGKVSERKVSKFRAARTSKKF